MVSRVIVIDGFMLFSIDYQPEGRWGHTSHVIEGNLYMWGGKQYDLPRVHDSDEKKRLTSYLDVFKLFRGKWEKCSTTGNPPLAIAEYSSAVIDKDIFYFGHHEYSDDCSHNSLIK